jgi:hypothetical protein
MQLHRQVPSTACRRVTASVRKIGITVDPFAGPKRKPGAAVRGDEP